MGHTHHAAVQVELQSILLYLLKLRAWPEDSERRGWRDRIIDAQMRAEAHVTPAIRQSLEMETLFRRAVRALSDLDYGAAPVRAPPNTCPVTLDSLLSAPCRALEAAFNAAGA